MPKKGPKISQTDFYTIELNTQSSPPSLNANHGWVSTAAEAAAGLMTQQQQQMHGLHAGNGGTGLSVCGTWHISLRGLPYTTST